MPNGRDLISVELTREEWEAVMNWLPEPEGIQIYDAIFETIRNRGNTEVNNKPGQVVQ